MERDVRNWNLVLIQVILLLGISLLVESTLASGVLGSSAFAQSSKTKPSIGSSKTKPSVRKKKGPVLFEPRSKQPVILAPQEEFASRSRKSFHRGKKDVIVLPFSLSKFKSVQQMLTALHKLIPDASHKELARMVWQMVADPGTIPPDLGGVFVPNIIRQANVAPVSYALYDKYNRPVAITQTGKKSFVLPGVYTVRIGRLANGLLPTYKVRVKRNKMTVIRPRWAALIIRVVDERLIQFRGTYDLIHLTRRMPIGTGIGADDELGEKVRPWLIPPGMYMIVRVGDSYLARTNYFTVQVDPGKVTRFRLVINKNTNQFLGGGVLLHKSKSLGQGGWRWSLQLNGNVLLNYAKNLGGTANGLSFSMATFFFGRIVYNKKQHYFSSTVSAELGFTVPPQGVFQKGADRLEIQAIYIYRLLPWLGPYVRAVFDSVILPNWSNFSNEDKFTKQDVSIYNCVAAVCRLRETIAVTNGQKLEPLQLSSVFDPILLKEGLGVNIRPLNTTWLNLRVLFGVGFRQEIAREAFKFDQNTNVYTTRCKKRDPSNPNPTDLSGCPNSADQEAHTSVLLFSQDSTNREGLEVAVVATGQITRYISYTLEFDALAPFEFSDQATFINFNNFEIDTRVTIILRLSHYASLNFRLRVRRSPTLTQNPDDPESKRWSIDLSNALSFSLLF